MQMDEETRKVFAQELDYAAWLLELNRQEGEGRVEIPSVKQIDSKLKRMRLSMSPETVAAAERIVNEVYKIRRS